MMRDELLEKVAALPPEADVGIRLGEDCLDIAGLESWGNGLFVALLCDENDLRDVLRSRRDPFPSRIARALAARSRRFQVRP